MISRPDPFLSGWWLLRFFCYTRNIIGYALSTGDSITTEWKDLGEAYYFKLVIHEDRQVEFFWKSVLHTEASF